VPLVVPEINPEDLHSHQGLIANPNCSTIQMVMALAPLHRVFRIRRVIVSTYQAVSGAGLQAIEELKAQTEALLSRRPAPPARAIPRRIGFNAVPQIGPFEELGYTSEEWKMVKETRRILHDDQLRITATTVRVPVINAHAESVYLECDRPVSLEEVKRIWRQAPGLEVRDEPDRYPTPIEADGRDEVFIGRIRPDPFDSHGLAFWVISDNLRKGAALNAVQIAEELIKTDE
jgi:aspartate-semialdehyde dehydrogenase